ncbi:MAG: GNAT family N-acetyltransferase [Lachnospiraceae bacterium]|nr:GNAT family N-acetyltransferase [Lachnospiraceae bacterium]
MIRLEEISPENWRYDLRVEESQQGYVSDSMRLLARAYAYRNYNSVALVIFNDNTPIGMALYYDIQEAYDFSQLFIDRNYQHMGYGEDAARQIIERMKAEHRYEKIMLCYIEGNEAALSLYSKLGFTHTGERDGNEIVMELCI